MELIITRKLESLERDFAEKIVQDGNLIKQQKKETDTH